MKKNCNNSINIKMGWAEDRICELENGNFEMIALEENTEHRMRDSKESLNDLWDIIKRNNLRMIEVLEGEEREKREESLFKEMMAENFLNLGRDLDIQVHEAYGSLSKLKEIFSSTH